MEDPETQDALVTMVELLKTNKYIRYAKSPDQTPIPAPSKSLNIKRSPSVDFWFSAFKESEVDEAETFFKQLGGFLLKRTNYLQVSDR